MTRLNILFLAALCLTARADTRGINPSPTVAENFGVNIHTLDPSDEEIQLLKDANLHTLRTDFSWEGTEKSPGRYDFTAQQHFADRLAAAGLRCMFAVSYSNPIYGNDGKPPYTQKGRDAFARWATAGIHQLAGRHILWEIWNEPNGKWFWPNPNAQDYSALVNTVGHSVRRNCPNELLVGPALYGIDTAYLDACGKAGALSYFDAITVHPYRGSSPETAAPDYHTLRTLLTRYSPRPLPLLDGEWGYKTTGPTAERDRAKYLLHIFLTDLGSRIPLTIWYDWLDDNESMGIISQTKDPSGATTFSPELAYTAAKLLTQTFAPYRFDRQLHIADDSKDFLLSFSSSPSHRYIAWTLSDHPTPLDLPLPNGDYQVIDALSEHPTIESHIQNHRLTIQLSDVPTYIVPIDPKERGAATKQSPPASNPSPR